MNQLIEPNNWACKIYRSCFFSVHRRYWVEWRKILPTVNAMADARQDLPSRDLWSSIGAIRNLKASKINRWSLLAIFSSIRLADSKGELSNGRHIWKKERVGSIREYSGANENVGRYSNLRGSNGLFSKLFESVRYDAKLWVFNKIVC